MLQLTLVNYPFEAPITVFVPPAPEYPHVYSNGHICMSLLTTDWSPAITMTSLTLAVLSMLNSATVKKRPSNDAEYCQQHPVGSIPSKAGWVYDDDKA